MNSPKRIARLRIALTRSCAAVTVILCCLGACTNFRPAASAQDAVPLPPQWANSDAGRDEPVDPTWWRTFGSEELVSVVNQAQARSQDVAAAVARVHQAQAQSRIAAASKWPTVDGFAELGHVRDLGAHQDGDNSSLGLNASYEVDLWGRLRASRRSALERLQASRFDRDTVQLSVIAAAVRQWLLQVSLQDRVTIARANLDNAQQVLVFVLSKERAGGASPLESAQQREIVATQRRIIAALEQQAETARTTLAVLMGSPVSEVKLQTTTLDNLQVPEIGAGVPSDLLVRRPDVARAESDLRAADANIAVARAAMLPSLTLSAGIGTESEHVHQLFDNPIYDLAAGLTAPIFEGGRLAGQRDLAIGQREELLAGYRSTLICAWSDTQTALANIAGLDTQRQAHTEELDQAERAFRLAQSRYKAGAETLLTPLDAQRIWYAARDMAVQLRLARLQAAVDLFQALGGGWQRSAGPAPPR